MCWNRLRKGIVNDRIVPLVLVTFGCTATETGVGSDVAGCDVTEYRASLDESLPFGTPRDIVEPVLGTETAPGQWLESGAPQDVTVTFALRDPGVVKVRHSQLLPDADMDLADACNSAVAEFPFRITLDAGQDLQATADFVEHVALQTHGLSYTWYVNRDQVGGVLGARTEFEKIRFYAGVHPCEACPSGRRLIGLVRGIPKDAHTGPREPCKILADGGSECPDYGETDLLEFATNVPMPDASLEASTLDGEAKDAGADAYVSDTLWDASHEGPDAGT